jgi:hypothetical protein
MNLISIIMQDALSYILLKQETNYITYTNTLININAYKTEVEQKEMHYDSGTV